KEVEEMLSTPSSLSRQSKPPDVWAASRLHRVHLAEGRSGDCRNPATSPTTFGADSPRRAVNRAANRTRKPALTRLTPAQPQTGTPLPALSASALAAMDPLRCIA